MFIATFRLLLVFEVIIFTVRAISFDFGNFLRLEYDGGISTILLCSIEDTREPNYWYYIPHNAMSLFPARRVSASEFQKGRLFFGEVLSGRSTDPNKAENVTLAFKDLQGNTLKEFYYSKLIKYMDSIQCSNNYDLHVKRYLEALQPVVQKLPVNYTVASIVEHGGRYHYYSTVDLTSASNSLMGTISPKHYLPSLYDTLLFKASNQQLVAVISTEIVVYLNRFEVVLEKFNTVDAKNHIGGYISSVMYGQRLHISLMYNAVVSPLQKDVLRVEKALKSVLYNDNPSHDSGVFKLALNFTLAENTAPRYTEEDEMDDIMLESHKNSNLTHLVECIRAWKDKKLENITSVVPVAIQVKKVSSKQAVEVFFTQCFSSTAPPLQLLMTMSKLLMLGNIAGILIAVACILGLAGIVCGSILNALSRQGRVLLPGRWFSLVPIRIYLISFWPFNANEEEHPHVD